VHVTEVLPGFVDTDMAKGSGLFWVAPVKVASRQIVHAIQRRKKKVYITKRWALVALLPKIIPDWLYKKL
jgi:short-subunit dehydrogenase